MSRMLLFTHAAAWSAARELAAAGRRTDALARLTAVLASPALPQDVATAANRLAGRLHLAAGRFAKARRHLLAAAKLSPASTDREKAELHHLVGLAFQNDPYGCDRRAARRFKLAAKLDPHNATYRAALGLACVRRNRVRAGVAHLEAAAALAPTDSAVLGVVLDGFREADRPRLGLAAVTRAMFLAPADAKIRRLWDRVRFDVASATQATGRRRADRGDAKVLPFLRVNTGGTATGTTAGTTAGPGGVVRRDLGVRPAPHFNRLRAYGDRA